jgi:hypothetical protein
MEFPDGVAGDWLEEDPVSSCLHNGFAAHLNVELLAQPSRNDDLAFGGKRDRVCLSLGVHALIVPRAYL